MSVVNEYDVVVVGGGPAGSVAAIAAARSGATVLLVEQNGYLGGALTAAGVGPQMTYHAGDTQVVRGIPEEIVQRLCALGASPGHMADFVGYASSVTPFNPEGMKYVLESMALDAGVTLLYHTVFVDCEADSCEGGEIASLRLLSKKGFMRVQAKVVVDCSADADVATSAGVPSCYGRESDHLAQPMTMNLRVGNVDRDRLMDFVKSNRSDMLPSIPFDDLQIIKRSGIQGAYSIVKAARGAGELSIDRDMVLCFETNTLGEYIVNMSRIIHRSAIDPIDLTYAEVEGRRQAWEIYAFLKKHIPGFSESHIVSTGPNIGVRESRKIDGVYKLTADDLLSNTMFEDAIAMGGYPIDVHSPDGEETNHRFLKSGSWYSVPYRCLVTREVPNLIVAGRCVSATHEACAAIRVTPIVMAMGQAAGTAAAQAASNGEHANSLDTSALRAQLRADGVFLGEYPSEN